MQDSGASPYHASSRQRCVEVHHAWLGSSPSPVRRLRPYEQGTCNRDGTGTHCGDFSEVMYQPITADDITFVLVVQARLCPCMVYRNACRQSRSKSFCHLFMRANITCSGHVYSQGPNQGLAGSCNLVRPWSACHIPSAIPTQSTYMQFTRAMENEVKDASHDRLWLTSPPFRKPATLKQVAVRRPRQWTSNGPSGNPLGSSRSRLDQFGLLPGRKGKDERGLLRSGVAP